MASRRKSMQVNEHERALLVGIYLRWRIPVDQYESRPEELEALCDEWRGLCRRIEPNGVILHYMRNERKCRRWVVFNGDHEQEDLLRSAFVEMLFALAVSDVAIHTSEAVQAPGTWDDKLPAFAHLALGLVIIASSWVGWRQSVSPGMKDRIKTVISMSFVGLLLDVFIVILYFVLVRNVEVKTQNDNPILGTPSAYPEAVCTCVIFAVYAVWDLVTDIFATGCIPSDGGIGVRLRIALRAIPVSVFASICSFGLSLIVWNRASSAIQPIQVVSLDLALICVVMLFRLLKLCENWLAPLLGVESLKAFKTKREVHQRHYIAALIFILGYIAALMFAAS